jgi:4-hydroxyphenylpyruvate dioxygenase-like putative hemolysin
MTLRARLAVGFLAIALLLAIPLAEALRALYDAKNAAQRLRDRPFAASVVASRVRAVAQQFRRAEARVIVSRGDPEPAEDLTRQQHALEALADSVRLIGSDAFEQAYRRSVTAMQTFVPIELAAVAEHQDAMADRVSEEHVLPAITALDDRLGEIEKQLQDVARHQVESAVESADAATSVRRAESLLAPVLDRTRGAGEAPLSAVAAPDGTQVFFTERAATTWLRDFLPTGAAAPHDAGITHIDHIALTQPFDAFDEAALFYRAVLGLEPQQLVEFAAPFGLLRNRAMRNAGGTVRIPLSVSLLRRGSWAPGVRDPQHVAFGCSDIVATAAALRASGTPLLAIPDNYYDDLDARLELDPALLAALRAGGILYDRGLGGEFFHLYTEVLGSRLFFEVVQRVGGYDGYGAVNAPVHMAAHHRSRSERAGRRAGQALSS